MWPTLLDMSKDESMQHLRCLEIDAFSSVLSALRAQGGLDHDKHKLIKEISTILHISQERHKAEIRRVVNDERLNTIAYHVNGEKHSADEWVAEGQRLIPLMARVTPQTAYSAIADEIADSASKLNKQLPAPSCTERKRPTLISPTHSVPSTSDQSSSKSVQYRMSEPEIKKRKLSMSLENSNLAQHLMAPPKISKIQQIYRQKTKVKQKEQLMKMKPPEIDKPDYIHIQQIPPPKPHQQIVSTASKVQQKVPVNQMPSTSGLQHSSKVNILQNISLQSTLACDDIKTENSFCADVEIKDPQPGCSSDNLGIKMNKIVTNMSINKVNQLTIKTSGASDLQKTIKVCTPRKPLTGKTVTTSSGQKLIVVSNPQTLTTSSILQRTLTTIPFKSIQMKNFDKFKIVTSTTSSSQAPLGTPIQIHSSKQKVVTVRTAPNKKMIPFSQVQVLNTKGGIKVLPLGGKLISKSNTNASSVYFMNTASGECSNNTKSTSSTPLLMSSKLQEHANNLIDINASHESTNVCLDSNNINADDIRPKVEECSPVSCVTDNLPDGLVNSEFIEALQECKKEEEVEQMDVIATNNEETVITQDDLNVEMKVEEDMNSYYIIDGEHASSDILIDGVQIEQPLEVLNIVGNMDPSAGEYSVMDNEQTNNISVVESHNVMETEPPADLIAKN